MHDDRIARIKARYPLAEIIPRYAAGARVIGGRKFWRCPFHLEKTPSFSITPDGLRWICFAHCGQGDVIDFIQRVEGVDWHGAIRILEGRAFTCDPPVKSVAPAPRPDDSASRREAALRIWREARPAADTPVETYLRARGIRVPVPPSLRYHPALRHPHAGGRFPALVAAVQGANGTIAGIHRTFLDRDGPRKADVESPKMMLGPMRGGAVRLGRAGASLLVAEGIETALSAMQASNTTAWAALSTSGLKSLALPFGVSEVIILADGDPAGLAAADEAADRWADELRTVRIAEAPEGADFNDLLTGASHV